MVVVGAVIAKRLAVEGVTAIPVCVPVIAALDASLGIL